MTYKLRFKVEAEKEWRILDATIRSQFKKKLIERLGDPYIPSSKLNGMSNCYKIKLSSIGRLVYEVQEHNLIVLAVTVGKKDRNEVY